MIDSSVPTISEFYPKHIPMQYRVIKDIKKNFDYSKGVHEVLLSGSVGSAKSLLMAHLAVTHCLQYPGACALIGRRAMPNLRDTLLRMITDHIGIDVEHTVNLSRGIVTFPNGSQIISFSWADKAYKKVRSYALSAAFIEELTENNDIEFYKEIRMRLNRLPHVPEKLLVTATNPDAPSHWAYEYFIEKPSDTRHTYYSITSDNPFLDKNYISQLKETLSPREAQRMLYGEWLELTKDIIYYNYNTTINYYKDIEYKFDRRYPIDLFFDFNIGSGKPMSAGAGQFINGIFHAGREFIVEGARTLDICNEIADSGVLVDCDHIRIFGDATGKSRDTRSKKSDYDIINDFFKNDFKLEMQVPLANPPVRKRHNLMNAQFCDANNHHKFFVYKGCTMSDKGLRLTKLKEGGNYIEDDSDAWQHITTAMGYWVVKTIRSLTMAKSGSVNL